MGRVISKGFTVLVKPDGSKSWDYPTLNRLSVSFDEAEAKGGKPSYVAWGTIAHPFAEKFERSYCAYCHEWQGAEQHLLLDTQSSLRDLDD